MADRQRGGSKPGERRGGRAKGVPNKATADVRAAAQRYTVEAIEMLASIMRNGESEAARVAAADKILDRAHGRPSQAVDLTGNLNANITRTIEEMRERVRAMRYPQLATDNGEAVSPQAGEVTLAGK
jgi:hypothetical protein